jgi:segregation and condensation protein A
MDITVHLETFHGPLDLLLYLVKRNEVDIFDIPIGCITDQYMEYLSTLQQINVEQAGEFVVMAATLMEIKSRMLLPRREPTEDEHEEDPRLELVKQLVEYRKFRDAAAKLEERAEQQSTRFPRYVDTAPTESSGSTPRLRAVELWDLVSAFGRIMREAEALQPTPIIVDETPQQVYITRVVQRLRQAGECNFRDLFEPPHTRSRLIGMFLAILEMVRRQMLDLEQEEAYGDIRLRLRPEALDQPDDPLAADDSSPAP